MISITKMKTERLEYFNQQSRVCQEQKQIQLICRFFVNQIVVHSSEKLECQKPLKMPLKMAVKIQSKCIWTSPINEIYKCLSKCDIYNSEYFKKSLNCI